MQPQSIVVIGRGIVGLSIAYEMVQARWKVLVLGPKARHGTASPAAVGVSSLKGHILPTQPLFAAKMEGHRLLPHWLSSIERDSGMTIPKMLGGMWEPFFTEADYRYLSERVFHGRFRGCLRAECRPPTDVLEGGWPWKIAPRGSFYYPGDHWFDPKVALKALETAILRLGGSIRDDLVDRVWSGESGQIQLGAEGVIHSADQVVLAAGAHSPELIAASDLTPLPLSFSPGTTLLAPRPDPYGEGVLRLGKVNYVVHGEKVRWGSTSHGVASGGVIAQMRMDERDVAQLTRDWEHHFSPLVEPMSPIWGVRTRFRDRTPGVGPLRWRGDTQRQIWVALGFYKNGLQLAGLMARHLRQAIVQQSEAAIPPLVRLDRRL